MTIRFAATAGMLSDTSLYNIDGACVMGTVAAPVQVGSFVSVTRDTAPAGVIGGSGQYKVLAAAATEAAAYGVLVRSSYESETGAYVSQSPANVLSAGRIWARATAAVTAATVIGAAVTIVNGEVTALGAAAATAGTRITFAGGYIPAAESPDGVPLVEVQVRQM
jgi:hypothetical protein